MSMIADTAAPVTHAADGVALHEALLAEARVALGVILSGPTTAREAAAVLNVVGGEDIDAATRSVLSGVLAG